MMNRLIRRMHGEQDGYALVIALLLVSIMVVLLVVALDAGIAALRGSSKGIEWSKTLTVAEAGVNDAVTRLGISRTTPNPCEIGTATVCSGSGGEYQVTWSATSDGGMLVTSIGYYPTKSAPRYSREVQVTYEPAQTFKYAIFAQDDLTIANNPVVVGDVYSSGAVTVDNNVTICGSITSANGTITLGQNDKITKSYAPYGCSGESGNVWAGGSILGSSGVNVEGYAKASGPSGATCASSGSAPFPYDLTNMTVTGTATACGRISGVTASGGATAGIPTTAPAVQTMPAFTFDPNNYSSLACYPSVAPCGSNVSTTAVSEFNAYVSANKTNLSGTFAIWQSNPTQLTKINLDGVNSVPGNLTIVTNAPIDFGNTSTITTTASSAETDFVSLYVPPTGTTCDTNGGDCSIYGQNSIQFGPNVVGLLYTTGKMAFKNNCNGGSCTQFTGAVYAGSLDLKNGFNITYNSAIERTIGFGQSLQQTLWQEINV
jgi:Tfp pilus assembly protein PilX